MWINFNFLYLNNFHYNDLFVLSARLVGRDFLFYKLIGFNKSVFEYSISDVGKLNLFKNYDVKSLKNLYYPGLLALDDDYFLKIPNFFFFIVYRLSIFKNILGSYYYYYLYSLSYLQSSLIFLDLFWFLFFFLFNKKFYFFFFDKKVLIKNRISLSLNPGNKKLMFKDMLFRRFNRFRKYVSGFERFKLKTRNKLFFRFRVFRMSRPFKKSFKMKQRTIRVQKLYRLKRRVRRSRFMKMRRKFLILMFR